MKRLVPIFLLFVMLLGVSAPVVAVHFCAKNMTSSMFVFNKQKSNLCCEQDISTSQSLQKENSELTFESQCCKNDAYYVGTDAFESNHLLKISFIKQLINKYSSELEEYQINIFKSPKDYLSKILVYKYPPQGLFQQQINLLTYICIYRI